MVFIKSIVSSFIAFTAVSAIPTELKPRAAFTLANGQAAQALNRKFATLTTNSACNAGENGCVGGQFAQCVGGKFAVTGCAGGLKCFALPLVNSAGTSITCDTEADALARIANTGATGGLTGGAAVAAAPAAGAAGATNGAAAKTGAKKGKGKKKGAKKGAKKAARDDHDDEEIDALIHELESHLATRDVSDQFDVDSLTVEDLDAILEGLQRRDSLLERRGGVPPNVLKTLLNVIKSIFTKKAARDVEEFDGVSLADLEDLVNSLERRHYDIERRGGVPPNVLQSLLNVIKGIFSKKKVARDIVERDFQSLIDDFIAKLFRPLKGVPKRELPAAVTDILKTVLDKLLQDLLGKIGGGAAAPAAGAKREIPQELQDILKTVVDKLLQDLLGKIGGGAAAPAAGAKREIPQEIQDILKTVLDKVLEGILSKIGGGAAAPAAGAKREIPQALQDIFKSILDKLLQTALSKIGGGAAAPAPAPAAPAPAEKAPAAEEPAAEAPAAEEPAAAKRDLADTAKGIFKSLLDKLIAKLTGKAAAPPAEAPAAEEPATEAPAEEAPAAEEPAAEEPAAAKRDLADTAKSIFKSLLDKLIAKLTGKGAAAPPAEEPAAPAEEPAAEEPAAEAPAAEEPAAATPRMRRRHARDFTPIVADE